MASAAGLCVVHAHGFRPEWAQLFAAVKCSSSLQIFLPPLQKNVGGGLKLGTRRPMGMQHNTRARATAGGCQLLEVCGSCFLDVWTRRLKRKRCT